MLAKQDLEILSGMVKNHLEKLILKRANEETSDQAKSSLDEEINGLYKTRSLMRRRPLRSC